MSLLQNAYPATKHAELIASTSQLVRAHRYTEAIGQLSDALNTSPYDVKLMMAVGVHICATTSTYLLFLPQISFAYEQNKDLPNALGTVSRLIVFLKEHNYEGLAGALYNRGRIYSKMNEKRKAIQSLDEAIIFYPRYIKALILKVMIGVEIKDVHVQLEAREALATYLTDSAERAKEYYKLAKLYYDGGEYKRSEARIDKAIRLDAQPLYTGFKRKFEASTESKRGRRRSKSRSRSRSPRSSRHGRGHSSSREREYHTTPRKPTHKGKQPAKPAPMAGVKKENIPRPPPPPPPKAKPVVQFKIKTEPSVAPYVIPTADILKPVVFAAGFPTPVAHVPVAIFTQQPAIASAAAASVSVNTQPKLNVLPILTKGKTVRDMSVAEVSLWVASIGSAYKPCTEHVRIARIITKSSDLFQFPTTRS